MIELVSRLFSATESYVGASRASRREANKWQRGNSFIRS
jgi:hypothetical protein